MPAGTVGIGHMFWQRRET